MNQGNRSLGIWKLRFCQSSASSPIRWRRVNEATPTASVERLPIARGQRQTVGKDIVSTVGLNIIRLWLATTSMFSARPFSDSMQFCHATIPSLRL